MTAEALEQGYWRAYEDFYRWSSIWEAACVKQGWLEQIRHIAYTGGWKKLEPLWDVLIRTKRVGRALPILETVLESATRRGSNPDTEPAGAVHTAIKSNLAR